MFNIVDKPIKVYSQNTNLLPHKPKYFLDILSRVSKNFIGSMFSFQQTRLQTTLLLFVGYTTLTL